MKKTYEDYFEEAKKKESLSDQKIESLCGRILKTVKSSDEVDDYVDFNFSRYDDDTIKKIKNKLKEFVS